MRIARGVAEQRRGQRVDQIDKRTRAVLSNIEKHLDAPLAAPEYRRVRSAERIFEDFTVCDRAYAMLPAAQINEVEALGGRAVVRIDQVRHARDGRQRTRVSVDLQPVALRQKRLRLPGERFETEAADIETAGGNREVVATPVEVQVHRRRCADVEAVIRASLRANDVAE